MKNLFNSLIFLFIVILIFGVPTTAYTENDTHSNSYVSLKQVVGDDPRSTQEATFAFLAGLPTAELLQAAEQASLEKDTVVLFGYTGREIIHRLRIGELGLRPFLDELERVQTKNDYYSYFLLWALNSSPHVYSVDEQRSIFELALQYIDIDKSPLFQKRLSAIVTSNSMLEELVAQKEVEANVVANYGVKLLTLATDDSEDPEIRRAAIKGISEVNYRQAIPELLMLAQDKRTQSIPAVARSVCLVLARFGVIEALLPIQHILETTQDEYIFGSAAIALADIGGTEALRILVDNAGRVEGGFAEVAIQELDSFILDLLLTGDEDALSYAIRATEYLYKENQVNQYKSILNDILFSTANKNLIRLILDRLQQLVNQKEAREIINKIPFDIEYSDQWEWMERLSNASFIESEATNVPTDEVGMEKGLRGIYNWEYGDPGYRANGWFFVKNRGHTGLMGGINGSNSRRILEIGKTSGNFGVQDNAWNDMIFDSDFWGIYTLKNTSMTFSRRRDVVGSAVILATYDIGYPVFPTPDLLRYRSSPGTKISPHEVSDLRCDGLVEYCYEYNSSSVWGKNNAHYDVSRTEWVSEHNNFYDWPWNSCEETAPDVQCGRSTNGGTCTYMTRNAWGDLPSYSSSFNAGCSTVDLYITATDQSGIHYIKAKRSGDASYTSSPVQPQHPNSASYSAHFSFPMSSSGWIYYYAKDNAGNYPDYAEGIYIELETTPSPPSPPTVVAGCGFIDVNWPSVSGAAKYCVYRDNSKRTCLSGNSWRDTSPGSSRRCYQITTQNECGESDKSSSRCTTAKQAPSTPNTPTASPNPVCVNIQYCLNWGSVSSATSYEISENNGSWASVGNTTSKCYTKSSSGSYSYRVRARNSCGPSGASGSRTVTIAPAPLAPTLSYPSDNASNVPLPITFAWKAVDNAKSYGIQISTNAGFNDPIYTVNGILGVTHLVEDGVLEEHLNYHWRVWAKSNTDCLGDSSSRLFGSGTDIHSISVDELPDDYILSQNHPNPFNPTTIIKFALPRTKFVTLEIYNVLGENIETLVSENLSAGHWSVTWDGNDMASGMYFYKINAGEFTETKKMILLK